MLTGDRVAEFLVSCTIAVEFGEIAGPVGHLRSLVVIQGLDGFHVRGDGATSFLQLRGLLRLGGEA
jgi:hypothetical protein